MNRIFTTVALQSAIAAAVLVAAPFANAAPADAPLVASERAADVGIVPSAATFTSTLSRADVMAQAVAAAHEQHVGSETESVPMIMAAVSTRSRADVRAEAQQAVRVSRYDSGLVGAN